MFSRKNYYNYKPPIYQKRNSIFVDREFQMKYTGLLVVGAFIGLGLVLSPVYYLMNQNYNVFYDLAYKTSPELITYLEREQIWMNIILTGAITALVSFIAVIAFRFTHRIVGPLGVLRNHLKQLSRGIWHLPKITIRDDDEFHELIEAYNYFYSSCQNQIKQDLENLKHIRVDSKDINSRRRLKMLIKEKSEQLNLPIDAPPVCPVVQISEGSQPPPSQRAS